MAELVCRIEAELVPGMGRKGAEKVLEKFEDTVLVLTGLFLDGGLEMPEPGSQAASRIAGRVTRADGGDLTERDRQRIDGWLAMSGDVAKHSVGPLVPADAEDFDDDRR
jgi:hypothetical protein